MKARLILLATAMTVAPGVGAQVATDGTLGARVSIPGPNFTIAASLGALRGPNLFHSLAVFNIGPGQNANFEGVPGLANIITRITDSNASTIAGRVTSTAPGAGLFLVNPNGIIFGPGASVDVNGSFFASSAHYVAFADGSRFEMSVVPVVTLTVSAPTGLGFESTAIAPVTARGATLRTADGATLGLVGGVVTLGGVDATTSLQSAGGRVVIAALSGPGSVDLSGQVTGASLADISIARNTLVDVSERAAGTMGGGAIAIRGAGVAIDRSSLRAVTANGDGHGIDISSSGDLTVSSSEVVAVTTGHGHAGAITLAGRNVTLFDGTIVDTSCDIGCTTGAGGHLEIRAGNVILVDGDRDDVPTYVVSNSFGAGATGEIDLTAASVVARGNAFVQGIGLAQGDATAIHIRTGDLTLQSGAQVDASARAAGHGGDVTVEATGAVRIEGTRVDSSSGIKLPSGLFSNTGGSGDAGEVTVAARSLEVSGGGEVSSSAARGSSGRGGNVSVTATESIRVTGADADGKPSGIATNTFARGDAGKVSLHAPSIEVSDDGRIQSQSEGAGRAGAIEISGGDVSIADRGQISSDARSSGEAGDVVLELAGTLAISGANAGIFAKTYAGAQGGSVRVEAANVTLDDHGGIFVSSDGTGNAGSIDVHATGDVTFTRAAQITTSAHLSDGGNIRVRADGHIGLDAASITTAVGMGLGNGGNVALDSAVLVMRDGVVSANAFGGDGGNIRIASTYVLANPTTSVTASSQLGVDGTVAFESPAIDLSSALLPATTSFVDVNAIATGRCGARLAAGSSSLVVRRADTAESLRNRFFLSCACSPL